MAMPRRLFTYLAARLKLDDILLLLQVTLTASAVSALSLNQASASELPDYQWSVVNPASPWAPRAGLQVVESNDAFYLMGGRTPVDPIEVPVFGASVLWADVWKSDDQGATWEQILDSESPGHWPGRAYFQAVTKEHEILILGGQNFDVIDNPIPGESPPLIPVSEFFNDVWASTDGIHWMPKTLQAGWEGRAGLSSVVYRDEIYIFGGSKNDDSAIIGPGGPQRIYFNDVWKSSDDGVTWEPMTPEAPWAPRAGAAAVVKDDAIYLLGGEDGFTCGSGPRCPPYFNDVWRTQDGIEWELVTESADWVARPGHQAVVLEDEILVFGGFGLSTDPADPFKASNPMDMWASKDGENWDLLEQIPWNAESAADIKYDFAALTATSGPDGRPAVFTFGGDRETFNPFDPLNYLNVDNDVWRFAVPEPSSLLMTMIGIVASMSMLQRRQRAHDKGVMRY